MSPILLDTVGFLALWNAQDQWHTSAKAAFAELRTRSADFLTTSHILLECGNAASRTPFRRDVVEIRQEFITEGKLITPTEADCDAAWASYSRSEVGDAGIVDHISFVVMRRLGIIDVFTNDRHFKAAGFNTLF
jgi:uncharacterized protein